MIGALALSPRMALRLGVGLAFALLLGWALRLEHLRAGWQALAEAQARFDGAVLVELRRATDNPALRWRDAPEQVREMGRARRELQGALARQNATIAEQAREAVRLRADAEELQRIAARADAQRRAALVRLEDLAITPGTREDCEQLLAEAAEALDLVREAGL